MRKTGTSFSFVKISNMKRLHSLKVAFLRALCPSNFDLESKIKLILALCLANIPEI